MRRTITLILCLFFGLSVYAQKGSSAPPLSAIKGQIKGQVKENSSKVAMEYANVAVYSLPDSALVSGTITSAEGVFEVKNLPAGNYYLVADFIGYDKKVIGGLEISEGKRKLDLGTILLEQSAVAVEAVEVVAEKDLVQYKIDKKVVNVDKKLSAKGGTVVDALENTPSIQVDAEGNVALRGSTSFTVLIDGKPTAMSSNDALKQIPASAVENVEIITNPSVKYDPDGTSGIINIIMKKEYKTGMNGQVNAAVGSYFQHNGDFNINYRTDKVNYFIGASYADRRRYPRTEIYNESEVGVDTTRYINQNADRTQAHLNYSVKGGLDFYLSPKTTLILSSEYGYFGFELDMPSKTWERYNLQSIPDIFRLEETGLKIGGNYINANMTLEQKFDEKGQHKLETSLIYSNWDGEIKSDLASMYTDNTYENGVSNRKNRTIQNDYSNNYRIKIDYTLPLNEKTSIETGLQSRFLIKDSKFRSEDYIDATQTWENDDYYDTGFDFHRYIHSGYFSIAGELLGLSVKAGLRGEYTDRELKVTEEEKYILDRFDIIPSLHLSKKLKGDREIQASYSRRVNRPQDWNLNPNPIITTDYISQAGNPDLLPEFIDSYELNIMQRMKKGFVALEGYYRQTNNAFDRTMRFDSEDDITYVGMDNLGKNFAYGAELSTNLNLAKWFSVYASANVYSFNISGESITEGNKTQNLNSDFVLNSNFTFLKSTRLQVTGFYNAPRLTSQGERSEMYGVNMALRRSFFKRKLDVVFRARDVLNTMKFKFESRTENSSTDFSFDMDSPTFMVSLSYRINNYKKRKEAESIEIGGGGVM
jgi:outer membrane receptor protein involved in Fe transport